MGPSVNNKRARQKALLLFNDIWLDPTGFAPVSPSTNFDMLLNTPREVPVGESRVQAK